MVNPIYMKGVDATTEDESAVPLELNDDNVEQMENIEKMMRPLTQMDPAVIIAGTVVAGELAVQ